MENIIVFIIAAVVVVFVAKVLFHVTVSIVSFLFNSLIGAVILWALNLLGLGIKINWLTSALVGLFGVPGVVIVLVLKYVFHIV